MMGRKIGNIIPVTKAISKSKSPRLSSINKYSTAVRTPLNTSSKNLLHLKGRVTPVTFCSVSSDNIAITGPRKARTKYFISLIFNQKSPNQTTALTTYSPAYLITATIHSHELNTPFSQTLNEESPK